MWNIHRTVFAVLFFFSCFENYFSIIFQKTVAIVSIILYILGSGAVRGFALVLGIGILTSLFSGVLLTKLLLYVWLEKFQPKKNKI